MSILKKIIEDKIKEVENDKKLISPSKLKENLIKKNNYFQKKLEEFKKNNKTAIVAEVKKASPSKGILLNNFDHIKIAEEYVRANAACLSILTEKKYFLGSKKYLSDIKSKFNIPILCKDFFIDTYQVYEAAHIGADCILILLNSVEDNLINDLLEAASICGLDAILEIHNEDEMARALNFNNVILGINNRNLNTFETDIKTTVEIFKKFELSNYTVICESGIYSKEDINFIKTETGINNFLIGESLIKSDSIYSKLIELNS